LYFVWCIVIGWRCCTAWIRTTRTRTCTHTNCIATNSPKNRSYLLLEDKELRVASNICSLFLGECANGTHRHVTISSADINAEHFLLNLHHLAYLSPLRSQRSTPPHCNNNYLALIYYYNYTVLHSATKYTTQT